jgi:hypothetical protein
MRPHTAVEHRPVPMHAMLFGLRGAWLTSGVYGVVRVVCMRIHLCVRCISRMLLLLRDCVCGDTQRRR